MSGADGSGRGGPVGGWGEILAPSLDDFELLARQAFQALPRQFRDLIGSVGFVVAEFPEDQVLEELEAETPFDILGLFQGVGLTEFGDTPPTGTMPNRIWLYRRPILDYWAEHEEALGTIVTHVLVHEIGHHFGLSDEDMDRIEQEAGEGTEP